MKKFKIPPCLNHSLSPMAGKMAPRGLLRPLRGSGFALGQPDSFVAGAFPFRLVLRAMQPQLRCSSNTWGQTPTAFV